MELFYALASNIEITHLPEETIPINQVRINIQTQQIIAIITQFIINKFIQWMSNYLHKPTLSEDTNRKLIMIRRNLLHDVLVYNQQSSQNRRQQKKNSHTRQVHEMNNIIYQQHENIKREDEEKRLNAIQRKQMLREEYERQIRQKLERQQRERQHDRVYAEIQKDYLDFSSQRRIYDIQRMFNRRSYKASINQNGNYNNRYDDDGKMESNRNSNKNRLKSEPSINYNPEVGYPYGKDYGYYARNGTRETQRQRIRTENGNGGVVSSFDRLDNKNSLSNIQIQNPTQKIIASNGKYSPSFNQANNFDQNSKLRQGISKNLDQHY